MASEESVQPPWQPEELWHLERQSPKITLLDQVPTSQLLHSCLLL